MINPTATFLFGVEPIPMNETTVTIPRRQYEEMLRKIERLEREAFLQSWKDNPDRMGS